MSGETGRVYRFTREYALDGSWGEAGRSPGMLANIRGIAELEDGDVAVLCLDTKFAVQRFSADGAYRSGFGTHEIGPGNVSFPSGLTVAADGAFFVSDELRQTIQVFDKEGSLLASLGGGGLRPGEFQYPSALASDGRSRLAVVERRGCDRRPIDVGAAEGRLHLEGPRGVPGLGHGPLQETDQGQGPVRGRSLRQGEGQRAPQDEEPALAGGPGQHR